MPQIITCPHCPRKLRVPDELLGKHVKCPGCGQTFQASSEEALLPALPVLAFAPEEPSASPFRFQEPSQPLAAPDDRGERFAGSPDDWQKVRLGLTFVLAKHVVAICFVVLFFCAIIGLASPGIAPGGRRGGPEAGDELQAVLFIGILVLVGFLVVGLLQLIGQVLCLWAPVEQKARLLAISSLCLVFVAIAFGLASNVVTGLEGGAFGGNLFGRRLGGQTTSLAGSLLTLCTYFVSLVELGVWLAFLRAVALNLRFDSLINSIRQLSILTGVAAALYFCLLASVFVAAIGTAAGGPGRGENLSVLVGMAGLGCGCPFCILALVGYIWYLALLFQYRDALARHVRRYGHAW